MRNLHIFTLLLFGSFFGQFCRIDLVSTGLFQRSGFPAVQVVGYIMALCTFGEASQYACGVRRTMAALAGRDHFVFVFMTGNTVDTFMLGISLAVQLEGLLVA